MSSILCTIFHCLVLSLMMLEIRTFVENKCELRLDSYECVEVYGPFLQSQENSSVHSLTISHSNLSEVSEEDFAQFANLTTITIIECSVEFPSQHHIFCGVKNLTELCIIRTNHSEDLFETFVDNTNLVKLNLSSNKISYIKSSFFLNQRQIKEIDLSDNEIEKIEEGTFNKLQFLRKLNISGNKIGKFFDPEFLSLASKVCAVCRPNNEPRTCTERDHSRCRGNRDVDQLWWVSHAVSVQLRRNPICSIFTGETNATPPQHNITTAKDRFPRPKVCRVYQYGHCYTHERRRMFVMEACGAHKIFSSPIFDRNSEFVSYTSKDRVGEPKSWDLDEYLFSAGLPALLAGGVILVLISAALGAYVTLKDLRSLEEMAQARRQRWLERRERNESNYIPLNEIVSRESTNEDTPQRPSDSCSASER